MSRLSRLRDYPGLRRFLRHYFPACALLVLVVSTTQCPCSPERRKFSIVSRIVIVPFSSLLLTALCYFSFNSFTMEIKLFKPHGPLLFFLRAPAAVRLSSTLFEDALQTAVT